MTNSLVTQIAPDFEAEALVNGSISKIKLSQFKGKFVVLLFYPLDLYICFLC
jgi:alkyl hydroperoxide reductase subunit AhpC